MSIDIESYLSAINSEFPCGDDLEYDAEFIELEQAIKGKPEVQMGESILEGEPPVWRDIIKQCENLLLRTRDLRVLVNYFRALMAMENMLGVSQGLALLNALLKARWETLYPLLDPDDDNDPTERINILMSLCDFQTTLKPLHELTLVESKAIGSFNFRDIQIAEGKMTPMKADEDKTQPTLADIEAAVQNSDPQQLKQTVSAAECSLDSLNKMEAFITEQVGIVDAPSFAELRLLFKEIVTITSGWLTLIGADEVSDDVLESDESENSEETSTVTTKVKKVPEGINNPQDVSKVLKQICDYYRKHEPSSPIPLLLERVSGLVGKDFLDVLKELAPNGVEQFEFLSGLNNKAE